MVGFVKIIITGNKNAGLAAELYKCYPDALFASRTTGFDLTSHLGQNRLADLILEYDIFINCAALWKFNQTVLLETIYKVCMTANHNIHIINVGSTTDRVKNVQC
jgi:hypothetical protein